MKLFETIDRVAVAIAAVALVVMMMLTTVSVIGRYFFNAPIPDDLVISEMLMVLVVFLPFSAVQAQRGHVAVTIFTDWMSNTGKVVLETIGVVVGLGIFTVVTWAVWTDFLLTWEVKAYVEGLLELPEYPARFVAFFGLALFAVRLLIDVVASIHGLAKGSAVASLSEEARLLRGDTSD